MYLHFISYKQIATQTSDSQGGYLQAYFFTDGSKLLRINIFVKQDRCLSK